MIRRLLTRLLVALAVFSAPFAAAAMPANVHLSDYYMTTDGDNWSPAYARALASFEHEGDPWYAKAGQINIGPGRYNFAETINITRTLILQGSGGNNPFSATELVFPPGKVGIRVHYVNTGGPPLGNTGRRADGSSIRDLLLKGGGKISTPLAHGLVIEAPGVEVRNVQVYNFSDCGIVLSCDITREVPSNCNGFSLYHVKASDNGLHGIYISGGDANAGLTLRLSASLNGGRGIFENSLIGNYHVAPQASVNAGGSYYVGNNKSTIVAPYAEGGSHGFGHGEAPAIVIGGNVLWDVSSTIGTLQGTASGNTLEGKVLSGRNTLGTPAVEGHVGSRNVAGAALEMMTDTNNFPLRLHWAKNRAGYWQWPVANLNSAIGAEVAGDNGLDIPIGGWGFPLGLWLGGSVKQAVKTTAGKPTSGAVKQGDFYLNRTTTSTNACAGYVALGTGDASVVPFGCLQMKAAP